ncbi:Grx4 family monothiol glutaredoxin [Nannocystis sp.]|uniref:Grx4 family monothiol glutaredoxin n=1 Tax=Nannocystis sp. TaxID=1962667 RepID=UPI0024234265|nr:Grx4 family monothiol glutaredoxin [Nannocystis sp.]MBK7828496.1 Grx4 family monothiol glutaredoxin [Nannocystis sp.]MBK9758052.1 Grx4 family monothiol glutaredoxin [Nannocystis sp.]
MPLTEDLRTRLQALIAADEVVLFMKGTRARPQCGFSASVVQVLDELVPSYRTVDVLADPEIRDGIKELSAWPTIPQLYVRGEFVGGADIVREMHGSGELEGVLGVARKEITPPRITVSARAAEVFREATADAGPDDAIRLSISSRFEHDLGVESARPGDVQVEVAGLRFVLDRMSAGRADGLSFDYVEQGGQAGFKIENPNAPPTVQQIGPTELAARMAAQMAVGELHLYDVRSPQEREIARIAGSTLLDPAVRDQILGLPRDTPLVFHCHHGGRSQQAAEYFLDQGFTRVANLRGGIEAWSVEVDPQVPRY